MPDVHTINDLSETNNGYGGGQVQNVQYQNPMMTCCTRIPIVTILMACVEFLLWFIFIFIEGDWEDVTCTYPMGIESGEVWRLITPSLMHRLDFQILFDILFLFMMGFQVELRVGSICFIWISVIFTIFTYFVNWVLSGIFYWANWTDIFYTRKDFGLFPLLMCYIMLDIRLTGSKWTSFFMIFPIPSAVLPFLYIGLSMLISFAYEIVILMLSSVIIGFISWTGALRFVVPRGKCLRAWEKKCCPKLAGWSHWANASVSDNVRHFPVKMGDGPEPFTCCCNRWKPPQMGDVEDPGNPYYTYQVHAMNPPPSNHDNARDNKNKKNKNKKGKKNYKSLSVDSSTSTLDSWGKGKGRTLESQQPQPSHSTAAATTQSAPKNSGGNKDKSNNTGGKGNGGFSGKARHL